MNRVGRKTSLLSLGALLVCGGVAVGAFASSFVTDAARFQRKPIHAVWPTTSKVDLAQDDAGRAWARSAFPGGLRKCPEMNPAFMAACRAEIEALMKQPAMMAGSYGGPLLVTTIEAEVPPVPVPEPEPEPLPDEPEIAVAEPLPSD